MNDNSLDHSFGDQSVSQDERKKNIRQVFEAVAPRYDLMNDFMSFGIHRLWKRRFLKCVGAKAGQSIVDLAGGTGDVAAGMAAADRQVVIVDPSMAMMQVAQHRNLSNVVCVAGSGEAIPLADESVDTLTIAFGIRNMTSMKTALEEIVRVLKPGGRFYCLEFSTPMGLIRPFYNMYSSVVIPRLGALVANQPSAYHYLVESIRRFPDQETTKSMLEQAGLEDVSYQNLSFGIACIHNGVKPNSLRK